MHQKGGLDVLSKVPKFKYTFNEKRKLFIGTLYPYAEYFLNCVTQIPFNSYAYNGNCEYINFDTKEEVVQNCTSIGYPVYILSGGSAYEILNKKFPNVNLYSYCDATGDIDVTLYPPKLTTNVNDDLYFLNKNGKINSFYENFTSWTFTNFLKNVKSLENILDKMSPSMVNFDISEYRDIPDSNKTPDLGFKIESVGKLYVVEFMNEDRTMFKIQLVCKIQDSTASVIDHAVEIIIPLPESTLEFSPSSETYSHPVYNTINLLGKNLNIQKYNSLIDDNINAYVERKIYYEAANENELIHKPINHISRIFYLYELIYKNVGAFQDILKNLGLLFLFGINTNKRSKLETLYYYKIIDDTFHKINVDTRFFLNSYLEIVKQNTFLYNTFNRTNSGYLMNSANSQEMQQMHDSFITELFNENLFEPSGLLTFPTSTPAGGKRRYKKNITKKNKTKKNKTKKNRKRKNINTYIY